MTGCPKIRFVVGFLALTFVGVFGERAAHAALHYGVVTANTKVRPSDRPATKSAAELKAGRNEFEAFQLVFTADEQTPGVGVSAGALSGPNGATIAAENITLYREAYYTLSVASNAEGAAGRWPDPLIPDVDPYVGEKRNAFPFVVPSGESRVVWIDILVPFDAPAGWYEGQISVTVDGSEVGTVAVQLLVGNFTLPSTTSLKSAFALDFSQPCLAHTGVETCDPDKWNEPAALALRERYIRAGLEHRVTIHDPFFQPPINAETIRNFEQFMLGHINGTGKSRLPGARLTTVRLGAGERTFQAWLDYAKAQSFYDRLFYYPVDEPIGADWDRFRDSVDSLEAVDPQVPAILTTTINAADAAGVTDLVDVFAVEITVLENPPGWETEYEGPQRQNYDAWEQANPKRELWTYQSCTSHGCGVCGQPSEGFLQQGWPNRVIDSSAVQNRAHSWFSFMLDSRAELYFATDAQLTTAWNEDGQCSFSGSGDGTLFYPGRPDIIGGSTDIPVASLRLKLIRESMEDYEYLTLVARKDKETALQIARDLFPHIYESAQSSDKLEQARDQLFALLVDGAPPPPSDGSPTSGGGGTISDPSGGSDGADADSGPTALKGACGISDEPAAASWFWASLLLLLFRRGLVRSRR